MLNTVFSWLTQVLSAVSSWYDSIAVAVGFDLLGFLFAVTALGIALAYLVLPAYGGSDKANKNQKKGND